MQKFDWEAGKKFGRLMLTGKSYNDGKRQKYVECLCDCGVIKFIRCSSLLSGKSKSCGCLKKENSGNFKDGIKEKIGRPFFKELQKVYKDIIRRCYNKKCKDYKNYGSRNIIVCQEWLDDFILFYDWAISKGWNGENGITIDRRNNNGGYDPINCRLVTDKIQRRNKRNNVNLTIFNETKIMTDWANDERCMVKPKTFKSRIRYGWDAHTALTMLVIK